MHGVTSNKSNVHYYTSSSQQDCRKNLNHFKTIKDRLMCLEGVFIKLAIYLQLKLMYFKTMQKVPKKKPSKNHKCQMMSQQLAHCCK